MYFENFVALRYLRSKRKEVFISIITVISILGVALSVMVLDIVLAVMTGFEHELQAKLIDTSAHITLKKYGTEITDYEETIKKIRELEEVVAAEPFTYNQAMITTSSGSRGILIRGVDDSESSKEKLTKTLLNKDDLVDLFNAPKIEILRPDGETDFVQLPTLIIGKALRDRLMIAKDSIVTLLSPQFGNTPQGLLPKARRFAVVGVYSSGLIEYENGLAYASIKDAQSFFNLSNAITGIEITVKDLLKSKQVAEKIIDKLGGPQSQLYATDWTEPNKPLWEAMKLEKQVYFIVLLLLILIASFSIVSTLVMVVMEKGRDIAVLKSMGATNKSILKIFFLQGLIIGIVGIIIGTVFGVLGCLGLREYGFPLDEAVFSLKQVPVHMSLINFIKVDVAAFFITLTAGIYPAWRASKLNPADALRYE
ncbi:MAG: ABC transporter permease [Proteobacteria bacterium]|nr:ABC transporter permease [Pseudomonadota bacterium]